MTKRVSEIISIKNVFFAVRENPAKKGGFSQKKDNAWLFTFFKSKSD